jgi:hypothetical protein
MEGGVSVRLQTFRYEAQNTIALYAGLKACSTLLTDDG